jgi:hypothetical protein
MPPTSNNEKRNKSRKDILSNRGPSKEEEQERMRRSLSSTPNLDEAGLETKTVSSKYGWRDKDQGHFLQVPQGKGTYDQVEYESSEEPDSSNTSLLGPAPQMPSGPPSVPNSSPINVLPSPDSSSPESYFKKGEPESYQLRGPFSKEGFDESYFNKGVEEPLNAPPSYVPSPEPADASVTGLSPNDSIEALDFDRSDDQKNSSFDEEPTSDSAQKEKEKKAAHNVMFQREFGTGLDTYEAMQDPNYVLGSGSALRQPARRLESKSGAMRRAARRLRRQGYGAAAQQMAMGAEVARLGQPSIDTPALRKQRMKQRIVASEEAAKQDKLTAGGIAGAIGDTGEAPKTVTEQRNEAFNARASGLDGASAARAAALKEAKDKKSKNGKKLSRYQTMEFRDANQNGIEDRQEGIYLPEDYVND